MSNCQVEFRPFRTALEDSRICAAINIRPLRGETEGCECSVTPEHTGASKMCFHADQAGRRMRLSRGLFLFRRARRETVGEETDDGAALTGCFVAVSLSVPPALAPALL
jgi:hypothetical protein